MEHRSLMTVHLAERHLAKAESTLGSFTLDFLSLFLNVPRVLGKGMNSAQVVLKQIPWIQVQFSLSHNESTLQAT